jgi:leucine dehydrogenase
VGVQGAGVIGSAVVRALARAGCHVIVADIDIDRARALATEVDGEVCSAGGILLAELDVLCPCATGGVVDLEVARRMRAFALCGAANNVLGDPGAADVLMARDILHVPDPIASAGGVIRGLKIDAADRGDALIRGLGAIAGEVLDEAGASQTTPQRVAEARAWARVSRAQTS